MHRLTLPVAALAALALVGCSSTAPEPSAEPTPVPTVLGPLPGADEPGADEPGADEPGASESPVTAEGDPDAPEGYPIAPPTEFPECADIEGAVAELTSGLSFDQAASDAQDQEDIAVERQCAWTAGDDTLRLTLSGITFAPDELVALSSSRLIVPDAGANERGLFVMGVGEPPVLSERFAGTVNLFDQFETVSVGWDGGEAAFTGQQAVDAAVAVHEVIRD
ncbi:hypothetical protein [Agrococcus sp. Marseille-Q4369]|uniref:hypothetical protein n=1 Tax=Agrococcus sp. Marseille-Q4369 TaxID=2810513 RepID=UPI001B8B04BD|nr:hypothetical protein [Agrococcus sp. Marseille-Q4369]QUW19579.1 hypothetical protein JSQ78_04565 [Agrococcus sp. Marseille-Q4369]